MDLLIDSREFDKICVGLIEEKKFTKEIYSLEKSEGHLLVSKLADFMSTHPFEPTSVRRIIVHTGPGAFVCLRTGISLALGLGSSWGVPVVGISAEIPSDLSELYGTELSEGVSASYV